MGDIQATINSSFKGTKHTGSSSSSGQPHIQESPEGTRRAFYTFNIVFITIDLFCPSVNLIKIQFG